MSDKEPVTPPSGVDCDAFTLAFLNAHEAECPACGYNVYRLTEARCPECGRPLSVRVVTMLAGFNAQWITILVVLGLAAGIGLLVAVVTTREPAPPDRGWWIVFCYFMGNIPMPFVAIAMRRLFIRLPGRLQTYGMLLAVIATTVMLIWFVALIERI